VASKEGPLSADDSLTLDTRIPNIALQLPKVNSQFVQPSLVPAAHMPYITTVVPGSSKCLTIARLSSGAPKNRPWKNGTVLGANGEALS
jgi:hypothetical protein